MSHDHAKKTSPSVVDEAVSASFLGAGKQFPIFVDLAARPPLVIGDDEGLAAKIRLLAKFAPVIDIMAGSGVPNPFVRDSQLNSLEKTGVTIHIVGGSDAPYEEMARQITGRPLVILETGDADLNRALADYASDLGVPVNIPDNIALSSFYLASLVDRGPVTIAISTSGLAPILGQNIRAKIEDMLGPNIGNLAYYLRGLREQLRHLPAALRRNIHHQIIDGPVARYLGKGQKQLADEGVLALLRDASLQNSAGKTSVGTGHRDIPPKGTPEITPEITVVEAGAGNVGMLSLDALAAIRSADAIIYDQAVSEAILDLARREVRLLAAEALSSGNVSLKIKALSVDGPVIYLIGGDPAGHNGASFLRTELQSSGFTVGYIASASNVRLSVTGDIFCQSQTPSITQSPPSNVQPFAPNVIKGAFQ